MKLIERTKKIEFPIYHYTMHLIVTNDIIASRKKRDKLIGIMYKEEVDDNCVAGMHSYNENNTGCGFIFVNSYSNVGTISHESFHAISRMFRCIGENEVGEEIFAYTLSFLTNQIDMFIRASRRKK